jgi:hypothetical protein
LKVPLFAADDPAFAQVPDGLRPAKALLDTFAETLADGITLVAGRASIDRR